MKNKTIEELVLEYLACEKSSPDKPAIREQLKSMGYNLTYLDELEQVNNNLDELPVPEPSPTMTDNFYELLSIQKQKAKPAKPSIIEAILAKLEPRMFGRLAYTFGILFLGWFVGFRISSPKQYETQLTAMSTQIQEMKELVTLNLLNQTSTVDRLKGLESAKQLQKLDVHVVEALLKTLNSDPNPSVRLVTLQTLSKFTADPLVRSGLVQAIGYQKSPMVILTLADMMISLQEKNAVEPLQGLLTEPDLNPQVKEKIEKSILVLI